ncbi:type I-F CRISPR-associated protein Csy2 [Aquisalimonas asiatica]|uniref:CRISPR-associated protein Csy2 n=1 Tax=Aquisalimonas asiatica TaxID=406100 RepID=A0A1H8TAL6_9GAMM|nr:type I-F CRISPR-associated protein Csy2 [Aquisalimonas asiatica]SEO87845.1 CRISPR-associated protein Csy2 [Aquisalimonas asiatica]
MNEVHNLLVLPRIRVQNANAISSPMTWGFPAMSAFVGLMHALERKLAAREVPLLFDNVGVICHDFEVQASDTGYVQAFHLTRNPVDKHGDTAAIVEEGRVHLDITLVFAVRGDACAGTQSQLHEMAKDVSDTLATMRVAGGSVTPSSPGRGARTQPRLLPLDEDDETRHKQFRKLCLSCLPGFALVARDDLLAEHLETMQRSSPDATALDAWLDLSRRNHDCRQETSTDSVGNTKEEVHWEIRRPDGWIVPIPIGYAALTDLFGPGKVSNTRDNTTPFRFVESIYSVGQWVSPHRLRHPADLLWYPDNAPDEGLYRLKNDYSKRHTNK